MRKPAAPPSPEDRLRALQADICRTLASPRRLQILALLQDREELSVGEMVPSPTFPST